MDCIMPCSTTQDQQSPHEPWSVSQLPQPRWCCACPPQTPTSLSTPMSSHGQKSVNIGTTLTSTGFSTSSKSSVLKCAENLINEVYLIQKSLNMLTKILNKFFSNQTTADWRPQKHSGSKCNKLITSWPWILLGVSQWLAKYSNSTCTTWPFMLLVLNTAIGRPGFTTSHKLKF